VTGEVDEDVGCVALDESGCGVIFHSVQVGPFARQLPQRGTCRVLCVVAMVKQRLHAGGIEILQQRLKKEGDRVVSQIRRYKSDAEFFLGLLGIEKNLKFIFCEERSKFFGV
jgi:hypothetical protein